jgi:oxygen-dependent protoporphyrinogen oxidase
MRGRILFLAGAATGYVLGARAGRRRYEQIKARAGRLWNDPKVQDTVHSSLETVQDFVKDKAPDVQAAVADTAKKVVSKVRPGDDASGTTSDSTTVSTGS